MVRVRVGFEVATCAPGSPRAMEMACMFGLEHKKQTEACLGELRRNEGLRRLIGIESEQRVPSKWNMSRFEETLGREPHLSLLKEVFDVMVTRLGAVVPDLGKSTTGDATGLSARRTKSTKATAEQASGFRWL